MRQRGRCLSIPPRFTRGHLDYTRQSRSACTERTENKNYCFCFHGVEVEMAGVEPASNKLPIAYLRK